MATQGEGIRARNTATSLRHFNESHSIEGCGQNQTRHCRESAIERNLGSCDVRFLMSETRRPKPGKRFPRLFEMVGYTDTVGPVRLYEPNGMSRKAG